MQTNIEDTIIQSLLTNNEYFSKVYSHLKVVHFAKVENSEIFKLIGEYYSEYQDHPKPKEIGLKLKSIKSEALRNKVLEHFKAVMKDLKVSNVQFMIQETERHVKYEEFKNAIIKGAEAVQSGGDVAESYKMMGDALSINFETNYGLDYTNSIQDRIEYYHSKTFYHSTGVQTLDDLLGGGLAPKTLVMLGAPPHGGKSVGLASLAANNLLSSKNGLYYTLEMSSNETTKRIDANLLDIDINKFRETDDSTFIHKYESIKANLGRLIVKEYPPGYLTSLMIENHLNELQIDEDFKPEFIYIDYIGLMASTRASFGTAGGSYQYYKMISEEVRAIAVKFNITVVTAIQLNRGSVGNADAGMDSIAESFGLAMTADVVFLIHKLEEPSHIMVNFIKNRNTGKLETAVVGIDYSRMRYYDVSVDKSFTANIEPQIGIASSGFEMDSMFGGF